MILYCYSEDGAYVGPVAAKLSPARPFANGQPNYVRPARSTHMPPPEAPPGQAAVFNGQGWNLVEDHRGKTAYHTQSRAPVPVSALGPLPDGHTLLAPPTDCCAWDGEAWLEDMALVLAKVRARRDSLLGASDWTQLPDVGLSVGQKAAWAAYRQLLRDFPQNYTTEKSWPTAPTE